MKLGRKMLLCGGLIVSCCWLLSCGTPAVISQEVEISDADVQTTPPSVAAAFIAVQPDTFFRAEYFAPLPVSKKAVALRGVVVPHHLLAQDILAETFSLLGALDIQQIVLIGPNHANSGSQVLTTDYGWQTPFGVVEPDSELIQKIVADKKAVLGNDKLQKEHSLGNLMAYLKYYLPQAKVIPIALHRDMNYLDAVALGNYLSSVSSDTALFISSVDFSHYLTLEQAEVKDRETLKILQSDNWEPLFALSDDNLDCPPAMGVLFAAMENLGIKDWTVQNHDNSGNILKQPNIETTSYFSLLFAVTK